MNPPGKKIFATMLCALPLALTFGASSSMAASVPKGPTAEQLLFGSTAPKLSEADKKTIVRELGFKVSADGSSLEDPTCGPVTPTAQVVGLTGHGTQDVFVLGGNLCMSGDAGSSVWLFTKDAAGKYQKQLGFPASGVNVRTAVYKGYHELSFNVPGLCIPVWRWNGHAYEFYRSEDENGQACKH